MCTPENLKELAVGHLWSKQIITSLFDINMLGACDDMSKIYVHLGRELSDSGINFGEIIVSGCGSGSNFNEDVLANYWIQSEFVLDEQKLTEAFQEMNRRAVQYQQTGGLHSAALISNGKVVSVIEDVGRHNAIDKIVGKAIFQGVNPDKCALITTGRLSSDMVLKSLGAGFPFLATRSIPTSLAVEIAEQTGITLVGRGHLQNKYVYCYDKRVSNRLDYLEKGSGC